ncbi:MAG: Creatinase [Alphaproteobacteria bacterium MarineAlpha3_Bin5]|nr:peptidase M24 [Magnetovibrio sp.]PPR77964.1 MAG: Creatinase [Alphaproteobacteria bacterium MarineAlpha3_Bin5]
MFRQRVNSLRKKMLYSGIDTALICDDDNIYYFSGYYDYLHMDFGRPTILVVQKDAETILVTPSMELRMAETESVVDKIKPWNDGKGDEWRGVLSSFIGDNRRIGIEKEQISPVVYRYLCEQISVKQLKDITDIVADMRMIKSNYELQLARDAGQVAEAMMTAGRDSLVPGVREYEVALATAEAGTRKAANLLEKYSKNSRMSPNIHFLQIMASGKNTTMPHHRASTRQIKCGEPVFLCFCGMTNFHRFKLGFDRTFWVKEISDRSQEDIYKVAVESQAAALNVLRKGVIAEEVHGAYAEVIQKAGFEYPFRCGRSTGFSFLEKPQLVYGDKTVLQSGMVFAVDGAVGADDFRAQVGDSFIITDDGYEQITSFSKDLNEVIVG